MEPDPGDPHGAVLRHEIFGDRIIGFRFSQHITAAGGVGVDETEIKRSFLFDGAGFGSELVSKREGLFQIAETLRREELLHNFSDLRGAFFFLIIKGSHPQFRAGGFEVSQFVPEKVLFLEGVRHFFRSPVEEFQQLFIVEQVPVVPDQSQIASGDPLTGNFPRMGQTHFRCPLKYLFFRCPEHGGKAAQRDQLPVAPDEILPPSGKTGIGKGGRGASRGEFRYFHVKIFPCVGGLQQLMMDNIAKFDPFCKRKKGFFSNFTVISTFGGVYLSVRHFFCINLHIKSLW